MRTVKIDKQIAGSLKKLVKTEKFVRKFGEQTVSAFVTESVRLLLEKHKECFSCSYHKALLADIELARQTRARASGQKDGEWVQCDNAVLESAKTYAESYGCSSKHVVEQGLVEHLMRPAACKDCPFYKEMFKK